MPHFTAPLARWRAPLLRVTLSLGAVLAGVTTAFAQTNLLVNGDAETGDTSGWVDPQNHGFGVTNNASVVYAGAFSFTPGLTGPTGAWNNEVRQDVSVAAYAASIDAGFVGSAFTGAGRTAAAGNDSDPGRVRLEFLSSTGTQLAAYDTGIFSPYNTWIPFSDSRTLPAGTRTLRVRLLGSRSVGGSTDCYFDDLVLKLDFGTTNYCTAKTNSQGCVPTIQASGVASLSSSTLVVGAAQVLNNKSGLLFWGRTAQAVPFQGGTLCIAPPTIRTAVQSSGGNAGPDDCSGAYSYAFTSNYLTASALAAGNDVYAQFWSRDPASPSTTGLTAGVHFVVQP